MSPLPAPAKYLLRVDDLCPTIHAERWPRLCELLDAFAIRPILAVVPDNRDPQLAVSPPSPAFWPQMRERQAAGATVALHGYLHLCTRRGRSLVPLHRTSEFAGAPREEQHRWMEAGLAILRGHGLKPRLWVAPRHGFDGNTLDALRRSGIEYLSDGLGRMPVCRGGVVWIPQQIWRPEIKSRGHLDHLHPSQHDDGKRCRGARRVPSADMPNNSRASKARSRNGKASLRRCTSAHGRHFRPAGSCCAGVFRLADWLGLEVLGPIGQEAVAETANPRKAAPSGPARM